MKSVASPLALEPIETPAPPILAVFNIIIIKIDIRLFLLFIYVIGSI